ncbi:MAG: hypothetical protein ACFFCD_18205 [Promethearchaeota archaeon]
MKLLFKKDEEHEIRVFQEVDGKQSEFSYVDMIKALIESKKMENPDISDDFTEAEIKSINSMVKFINQEISSTEEQEKPHNS